MEITKTHAASRLTGSVGYRCFFGSACAQATAFLFGFAKLAYRWRVMSLSDEASGQVNHTEGDVNLSGRRRA